MSKKRNYSLITIAGILVLLILFSQKSGFCLSPQMLLDSSTVQKAFDQKNAEDKILPAIFWQESSVYGQGAKEFMIMALKQLGYKINVLEDFDQQELRKEKPPIAILNPESAKELGPMLRTLNPNIRIVIVSSYLFSDAEISSMGGDYYLQKNYSVLEFAKFLKFLKQEIALNRKQNKNHSHLELPEWSAYSVDSMDNHPQLQAQLGEKALEYQRRLLKRKTDGALFFIKTRYQPRQPNQLDFIWQTKNEASRENAAFALGRFMDANVCDIILPEKEQAKALASYIGALPEDIYLVRAANDYKLSDEQVRQKTFKKAFTRNLVLAILIRKYDFHAANHSPISDAQVAMMFDNDQSFHKDLININMFTLAFMENFFPTFRYKSINARQLLDFISVEELVAAVDFCENKLAIGKVLDEMAYRQVESFIHIEYAEARAKTLRADMLEFFQEILGFNQVFKKGTPEYEQLSQEITYIREALSQEKGNLKAKNNQLDNGQDLLLESI
ncbi:MAG: hypothetical protein V1747_00700 [Candidatus Omnitrophota bacterium]